MDWLSIIMLLIVASVFYKKLAKQLQQLQSDVDKLQAELRQQKRNFEQLKSTRSIADSSTPPPIPSMPSMPPALPMALPITTNDDTLQPNQKPKQYHHTSAQITAQITDNNATSDIEFVRAPTAQTAPNSEQLAPVMEPDEHSIAIVTSVLHSLKNWFLGGNLVVRVGVIVLLVGVVLLLRLLSDYIEIPIHIKLVAIGISGLGLAGLGLTLVKNRFAYGITLQGTGLAIAYLTTFFAYAVYNVMASLPSFMMLGVLSAVTIGLAVRQNAFPLALLALSGGFFAPILTADDTGSLVALFSYYLLLNVTIAIIAQYRTWKVLNLLGVTVTFGLAYYWGATENLATVIETQRGLFVTLVALHLALYLFVAIRYTEHIIAYNMDNEALLSASESHATPASSLYLYPMDIGLLFSVPVLAFGLFAALLYDIEQALTFVSAILAATYLGLGGLFVRRSQRYALITEGMLALGFGFLALVIPLALDAEWVAFGWCLQGLALVWFGRRSLRAWLVLLGLSLQVWSIGILFMMSAIFGVSYSTLVLTISAISALAAVFIVRESNAPRLLHSKEKRVFTQVQNANIHTHTNANTASDADIISTYATTLGISTQAAQHWLASINSQSLAFRVLWQKVALTYLLTLTAVCWTLFVLMIAIEKWITHLDWATSTLLALSALISVAMYWLINRRCPWSEISHFSHGLLLLFYGLLAILLPQKSELPLLWTTTHWAVFTLLIAGWLVVGHCWLKAWHSTSSLSRYDSASWLGTGVLVIAGLADDLLPASDGVMTVLIPVVLLLMGLGLSIKWANSWKNNWDNSPAPLRFWYWFNWQDALVDCAKVFAPLLLGWVVITNWTYEGVIWELPYLPLLNVYDITSWLVLLYAFSAYNLSRSAQLTADNPLINSHTNIKAISTRVWARDGVLVTLALIGFWLLSSMLIRTLHAYIDTPLWHTGAWRSEQVQTGLTMLWTLSALLATIIASRTWQRTLWLMGIGLLGVVVLKLVLVDLSQTEAIWRVISFIGAGSLILLIGYLAPLPPESPDNSNSAT